MLTRQCIELKRSKYPVSSRRHWNFPTVNQVSIETVKPVRNRGAQLTVCQATKRRKAFVTEARFLLNRSIRELKNRSRGFPTIRERRTQLAPIFRAQWGEIDYLEAGICRIKDWLQSFPLSNPFDRRFRIYQNSLNLYTNP